MVTLVPRTDIEPATSYDQNWDDFDHLYIDFALQYTQQLLTLHISSGAFESFPRNLPPVLIVPILARRYKIFADEKIRRGTAPDPEFERFAGMDAHFRMIAAEPLDEFQTRIAHLFESIYALSRWGKKLDYTEFPDFERVLLTQHVITVCSFAEGFYSNAVRYLAKRPPYPFTSWQQQNGTRNSRHAKKQSRHDKKQTSAAELFDKYLFDMGRGIFNDKLIAFERAHGVALALSSKQKEEIRNLFLLRNHLVHNAGRGGELIRSESTRWTGVKNGDLLSFGLQEVKDMIDELIDVIAAIYTTCSLKLLGKTPLQLVFGPKRV